MAVKKHKYNTREAWHDIRRDLIADGRLGGSMIGTAVGVNPYKSPYTLWGELTGQVPEQDLSGKEAVQVGVDLEDYVAKRFVRLTGKRVRRENSIMTNDNAPHLFASVDRIVVGDGAGLECKTASAMRSGSFERGEFPDAYYRQCKSYMAVTGLDRWYLAVLVMGVAFRVYLITRLPMDAENPPEWLDGVRLVSDMELDECEDDAAAFMGYVRGERDPEELLHGYADERASVASVTGAGTVSEPATLGADCDDLIGQRTDKMAERNVLDQDISRINALLLARLNGHNYGTTPAGARVSYTANKQLRVKL